MTALTVETLVTQLSQAGLNLSLAPAGGLAVAPSSRLTADLRALIRSSKVALIEWLEAANDATSDPLHPPDNPSGWRVLAEAYHAHHFSCVTCIAAGRGSDHGTRCRIGLLLWETYQRHVASLLEVPNNKVVGGLTK